MPIVGCVQKELRHWRRRHMPYHQTGETNVHVLDRNWAKVATSLPLSLGEQP